jgi:hypothetical protein
VRRALVIAAALSLGTGCGESRTPPPDVVHPPRASEATRLIRTTTAGVTFRAPDNWRGLAARPPLEGGVTLRTAAAVVWRYPRTEPLPRRGKALAQARDRLVERARLRNPTFALRSSELTRVDGEPAIVLLGSQTTNGATYDVRSTHVFAHGAEVVVDAYALAEDFPTVDREVFTPLLESMTVEPV